MCSYETQAECKDLSESSAREIQPRVLIKKRKKFNCFDEIWCASFHCFLVSDQILEGELKKYFVAMLGTAEKMALVVVVYTTVFTTYCRYTLT